MGLWTTFENEKGGDDRTATTSNNATHHHATKVRGEVYRLYGRLRQAGRVRSLERPAGRITDASRLLVLVSKKVRTWVRHDALRMPRRSMGHIDVETVPRGQAFYHSDGQRFITLND